MLKVARVCRSKPGSGGARFLRSSRLLTPADFRRVFRKPLKLGDQNWTVLHCANALTHPRLGLAITKKVLRKAVDRNRVKRIVRETFRNRQLINHDIVILARRGIGAKSNQELHRTISKLWDRLGNP